MRQSPPEPTWPAHGTIRVPILAVVITVTLVPVPRGAAGQEHVHARAAGISDWSAVDQALGRKGAAQPGGVMRYGFSRSDLQVTANGVQLKPAFALGSWVGFKADAGGGHAMMMGDLVLTEGEIAPVMRSLQRSGVQ